MSARLPSYSVPQEILDLVQQGYFEELTQPGDDLRNFGFVYPSGSAVLLWVDRERFERRKRTMFQFGVAQLSPGGELQYESSGNNLEKILEDYAKTIERLNRKYRKRWSPERTPRPATVEW